MRKRLSEEIRQTYILLYEKDDVRYIFNRSVRWDAIMDTKNIEELLNVLGEDAISHFIKRMNDNIKKMTTDINDLTQTFVYEDTVFYILEIHPEWENYQRENQKEINERKTELCKIYHAVDRKDEITGEAGLELQIAKMIKNEFKKWLHEIYSAISRYSYLIYDETIKTTLWLTKESLLDEINKLRKEQQILINRNADINKLIDNNKRVLRKQNFVIDNYLKFIERMDEQEELDEIKSLIAYGKYYE